MNSDSASHTVYQSIYMYVSMFLYILLDVKHLKVNVNKISNYS